MQTIILALISALAYGVSDFLGGLASRRYPAMHVILLSYPVSAVVILFACPLLGGEVSWASCFYGAASGIAMAAAIGCFYVALARGPMSLVSPITAVLVAALPASAGLLMGESPSTASLVGICAAIVAIYLVSQAPAPDTPTDSSAFATVHLPQMSPAVVGLSLAAGAAFAVSFFFAHLVPPNSGLWPIFIARLVATLSITAAFLFQRKSQHLSQDGTILKWGMIVGILDAVANATMYYALQSAYLSTTSVIISLYPVFTVALAMVVIKERLNGLQQVGMVLALGAIIVISCMG